MTSRKPGFPPACGALSHVDERRRKAGEVGSQEQLEPPQVPLRRDGGPEIQRVGRREAVHGLQLQGMLLVRQPVNFDAAVGQQPRLARPVPGRVTEAGLGREQTVRREEAHPSAQARARGDVRDGPQPQRFAARPQGALQHAGVEPVLRPRRREGQPARRRIRCGRGAALGAAEHGCSDGCRPGGGGQRGLQEIAAAGKLLRRATLISGHRRVSLNGSNVPKSCNRI